MLALLGGGCPVPPIVFAFGLDERTVADWQRKVGQHAMNNRPALILRQEGRSLMDDLQSVNIVLEYNKASANVCEVQREPQSHAGLK